MRRIVNLWNVTIFVIVCPYHGFLKVSKSGIEWTRMDLIFVKFA